MNRVTSLLVLALMGLTVACSRSPHLAGGPIEVSGQPTTVRFVQPVPGIGERWELCFEFNIPGDSHSASSIQATLVTTSGERQAMVDVELDRRGESVVCQMGRVASPTASQDGTLYESVELQSTTPLRLRGIRGGPLS